MKRILLLACLALAACGESQTYLKIQTGGIAFDKTHSQATMAIVVKALKPLPEGGSLSAEFKTSAASELQTLPAQFGQLLYKFEYRAEAAAVAEDHFQISLLLRDASGKTVEKLDQDFGGMIDKHDVPVHSDMVPDRERQVRQYNDEGF